MGEPMRTILPGLIATLMAVMSPALADDAADIRARLEQWTEDFNAKRAEPVCDLFSKELLSTVRGQGDKDYATRCDILTRSLNDAAREYHYELDLHEVIVEGDLAVVRLTWTLFVTPLNVTAVEPGIDVFRKEADGKWRIIRYLSYEEEN
jgi:steroid delta-isomerase